MEYLLIVSIGLVVCAVIGKAVGSQKNAGGWGMLLGLFLGPIGIIVAALIDGRPICPTCGTKLNGKPKLCPSCKTKFSWWKHQEGFTHIPPKD